MLNLKPDRGRAQRAEIYREIREAIVPGSNRAARIEVRKPYLNSRDIKVRVVAIMSLSRIR